MIRLDRNNDNFYFYSGNLPSDRLRQLEIEANQAFEQYREMYFEGGVSSVYFWDLENGFAGVILIKKVGDGSKKIKGCWDSIHVVEVQEKQSGRSAHYKLTSTVMLWLQTHKISIYLPIFLILSLTYMQMILRLLSQGALEKKLSENIIYLEKQARHTMITLAKFADDHILPVNIEKTKVMLIHSAVAPSRPWIEYKNVQIEYVNNFKCLGVDIGTKLGWSTYIDNRLKKARNSYCALRKIFSEIPKNEIKLRRKLFCAFSLPHFIWLMFSWFYYTEKQRAKIEHVYLSGLRLVYGLWGWDDYTTLILAKDYTLRDYIFKYWKKFMKHLDESSEGLIFQQTWTAFLIATSPSKSYYKSMGFRSNSKFANRLATRAQHIKLDVITFFNNHNKQYGIFKKSTAMIEYFAMKFFPP